MTARVFCATSPNHEDAESQAVLEWSLRKHASVPVDLTWLMLRRGDPTFDGWETSSWATPFSGLRWTVPELCGFSGHAIYVDSDFIFLDDVAKLWDERPHAPYVVTGKGGGQWRLCCSVWDCAAAREHLPPIAGLKADSHLHPKLNQKFRSSGLVQAFRGDWNNLDGRDGKALGQIQGLHYTDMSSQPHLPRARARLAALGRKHWYDGDARQHPRTDVRELFTRLLHEAAQEGYTVDRYTQHEPYGPVVKRSFAKR